mmetsp:Transcript_51549/g.144014  ORF Transcript_51549/g.144014 Transcript_51549/m.144014 type:complete len:216 (-) Transcript_51549:564-1211(-)
MEGHGRLVTTRSLSSSCLVEVAAVLPLEAASTINFPFVFLFPVSFLREVFFPLRLFVLRQLFVFIDPRRPSFLPPRLFLVHHLLCLSQLRNIVMDLFSFRAHQRFLHSELLSHFITATCLLRLFQLAQARLLFSKCRTKLLHLCSTTTHTRVEWQFNSSWLEHEPTSLDIGVGFCSKGTSARSLGIFRFFLLVPAVSERACGDSAPTSPQPPSWL